MSPARFNRSVGRGPMESKLRQLDNSTDRLRSWTAPNPLFSRCAFLKGVEGMVHSIDQQNYKFEGTWGELLGEVDERPTTSLAKFLQAKSNSPDYAEALEATMAESVDTVLRAQYDLSERERPRPHHVVKALSIRQRADLILWIQQAFSTLGLDESMVHGVALNIDRLVATYGGEEQLPQGCLQVILLAVVCTEFKTDGFSDHPDKEWKQILLHMTRGQVPMLQILRVERDILGRLRYVVGLPTPLTFLRSLTAHLCHEEQAGYWISLATFILELAMLEPEVQHGFPHAFLAAGALAASLRVLDAPERTRQELLDDVMIWPAEESSEELLVRCEEELLQLWIRCKDGLVEYHHVFRLLEAKFRYQSKFEVWSSDRHLQIGVKDHVANLSSRLPRDLEVHLFFAATSSASPHRAKSIFCVATLPGFAEDGNTAW
ncbi:unnamed protein product [Durusdinium trenchii]|uniref:Cyclin C-terminal domain-containing protein n=1 Tax=Durusdinium trenchii TaxID=1381693 RepID=A0ABP0QKH7_9DINO